MNKRISFLAVLIFALGIATVVAFSPARGGQETQQSDCEKACKKAHNQCRQAAGANLIECKKAYDACLEACKTPTPEPIASPSPEMTPSPAPSPSPEMTPSPAPSPSPEMTPSPAPSPSPEMTPSPTPSPSPEITPSPKPSS